MKPLFNGTQLSSHSSLAAMLGVTPEILDKIVLSIPKSYKDFCIKTGKNKKERAIFEPKKGLKYIQKKINEEIFCKVKYPVYLHGGLKNRDYVSNAGFHSGKKTIISLDITNFYPSISKKDILNIFKNMMRFSPSISETLTKLVTLNDKLPQGACTSSYIANLIFFNDEHNIVSKLNRMGMTYTRLLDDITISSDKKLSKEEETKAITTVIGMINRHRLSINNDKTVIEKSDHHNSKLHVTGLWVKHKKPKVSKENRRYIRYLVFICQKESVVDRTSSEYHKLWNKASGKVAQMHRLGHPQSIELREKLSEILPLYDEYKIRKIVFLSNNYIKNFSLPLSDEQIKKVNKIIYEIGIVGRTNKKLANELRGKMKSMLPKVK
ncbi:reverse transcriptase family protein [Providencia rettgeri]|uniref:reverse transcriptase family protein n=3 Tax=Enterobacterales TaxID=91347 RepID=UPI000847D844|nr:MULTISPECIES: reverse transcriptase family protein [unclassified Shigella]ODQ05744.1 reverse transcriptase [Shigella sp. FC130]ODQ05752.1 reverse transcriptase [Shigella sp. FC130]OEJ07713.1 reverse transcriptase [Shigella sp. FC1967]